MIEGAEYSFEEVSGDLLVLTRVASGHGSD